ncbi:hypothetical protein D9M68_700780 [compost metagenome]
MTVVGGVGQDRNLLVAAAGDGLFDDHRRLDAVVRRVAEHVVVRVFGRLELVRDHAARGHVVEDRDLGVLVEALRGQRHAGVDVADGGRHLFLVDQFLGDLHAAFVLGFIVALHRDQLPSQHAAVLVDLFDGQAHAIAHADAHGGRAPGVGAGYADLDRVGRMADGRCGKCEGSC